MYMVCMKILLVARLRKEGCGLSFNIEGLGTLKDALLSYHSLGCHYTYWRNIHIGEWKLYIVPVLAVSLEIPTFDMDSY